MQRFFILALAGLLFACASEKEEKPGEVVAREEQVENEGADEKRSLPDRAADGRAAEERADDESAAEAASPAEREAMASAKEEKSAEPAGGTPTFAARSGWKKEIPTSNMRSAQFRLPGDTTGDAEVVVFFFDGGGGDVESNFLRWEGQFRSPEGDPVLGDTDQFEVRGRRIDVIELKGTYSGMSGDGGAGMAMVGAIVESEYGPYFVRLLGPEKSVENWRASFQEFLKAVY